MTKLILSDCDGVILDWETHFHNYMKSHGHKRAYDESSGYWKQSEYPELSQHEAEKIVYHFTTSAWMIDVPVFRDARSGIATLVENGYQFHAITAMGVDPYGKIARQINLDRTFGNNVFSKLTMTDMYDSDSKRPSLEEYKDTNLPWIEDKPENAILGASLGLNTFLMDHPYNQDFDNDKYDIQRVNSWSDICGKLLGTN